MDKQEKLDQLFAEYSGERTPGAAVLVIQRRQKVLTGTYGMANLGRGQAVRPATNFRLASMSKQFTAMSVLILVDRASLSLETTLRDVIPEFPEFADQITVTHLLQHTSGLVDYEDFVPSDSPTQVTDRDVVNILIATDSTYFEPGTDFRYSNSGYAVLSQIVERIGGMPFAEFLDANVFEPLGMENTVAYENGISTVPTRAYGYTVEDSVAVETDQSPTSAVLGDGGIYSSLNDLYKWDQALYTETLIPAPLLIQAFEPNADGYGFGWRIDAYNGRTRYHHTGGTSGFRNFIQRFPDEELTIIILTNRSAPSVKELGETIADWYN